MPEHVPSNPIPAITLYAEYLERTSAPSRAMLLPIAAFMFCKPGSLVNFPLPLTSSGNFTALIGGNVNICRGTLSASFAFPEWGVRRSFMTVRSVISPFIVSSALLLSNAWAAEPTATLSAGKPAGLRQAQLEGGNGMFVVAGAALIGITVGLATSGGSSQPTTTTMSTPGTSP